jgi:hypothetical protein
MVNKQIKNKVLLSTLVLLTAAFLVFGLFAPTPVQAKSPASVMGFDCVGYFCLGQDLDCIADPNTVYFDVYCTNWCQNVNNGVWSCMGSRVCTFDC